MEKCGKEAGRKTASDSGISLSVILGLRFLGLYFVLSGYLIIQVWLRLVRRRVEGALGMQACFCQVRCSGRVVNVCLVVSQAMFLLRDTGLRTEGLAGIVQSMVL